MLYHLNVCIIVKSLECFQAKVAQLLGSGGERRSGRNARVGSRESLESMQYDQDEVSHISMHTKSIRSKNYRQFSTWFSKIYYDKYVKRRSTVIGNLNDSFTFGVLGQQH